MSQSRGPFAWTLAVLLGASCSVADDAPVAGQFAFEDVTAATGLQKFLEAPPQRRPWRYGHGSAWGDIDGDGRPDLFVGAFAARKWFEGADAPIPNMLLRNLVSGFVLADDETLQARASQARCAGALFVDLDEDGDLDLVVMNHAMKPGRDGWLYFSTHRGSTKATTDANHYRGDWILRADPATGAGEFVVCGPVPKHCIPNGVLDPQRLIFYGGTAQGDGGDLEGVQFFAYDLRAGKVLYAGPDGPSRCMILASSTGRVYFTPGLSESPLMRFDPATGGPPVKIDGTIGIRAATGETPQGRVYTESFGRKESQTTLYSLDTKTEQIEDLGPAAVGVNQYVAAIEADPTGRYLYYVPGAHGGSDQDNSAVVQFDTRTRTRKVIAFLQPYFEQKFGCVPKGTYALAVDDTGSTLYVTWNISRGSRAWDCCGLTAIHIPPEERP